MNQTNLSFEEASGVLKQPVDKIKAALKDVFKNDNKVSFSTEDIDQLRIHFSEQVNQQKPSNNKPAASNRQSGKSKNANYGHVNVITRKRRGQRSAASTATPAPLVANKQTAEVKANPQPATNQVIEPAIDKQQIKERDQELKNRNAQLASLYDSPQEKVEEIVKDKPAEIVKEDLTTIPTETKESTPAPAATSSKPEKPTPDRNKTIRIGSAGKARKNSRRKSNPQAAKDTKQEFKQPVTTKSRVIEIPQFIKISALATLLAEKSENVYKKLNEYQEDAYSLQEIDQDTAVLLVEELGHIPKRLDRDKNDIEVFVKQQVGKKQVSRPPVVTVMGHVDHGKTTLLDHIRKSKITSSESGGITQHIGAYQVETKHGKITMIDTPGHEVFSEMRARGADITDIVVLVVAIDDGVKPQTLEAIQHAKAAGVEIIVAINKCDLPDTNDEHILNQLAAEGISSPEWGGTNTMVKISALKGDNVDGLLKEIIDTAEVLDLKAPIDTDAYGTVIEAKTEKGLGTVITGIVTSGVLKKGQHLLCDIEYGKIRMLRDENGNVMKEATPSMPVQIQGFSELPRVGSEFFVASTEAKAREQAKERRHKLQQYQHAEFTPEVEADSLDEMLKMQKENSEKKTLNVIIKTDVAGTCEAMIQSLEKIGNENAKFKVVLKGVGPITESDVNMAQTSKAILVGFRVNANSKARKMISEMQINTLYNDVFYEVTDYLKNQLEGLLKPVVSEEIRGIAEIKELFSIHKVGKIAGCGVIEGTIDTKLPVRVVRNGKIVYKTKISELRHYKNKVESVKVGSDCGIFLEKFTDFKAGDRIEAYEEKQSQQTL